MRARAQPGQRVTPTARRSRGLVAVTLCLSALVGGCRVAPFEFTPEGRGQVFDEMMKSVDAYSGSVLEGTVDPRELSRTYRPAAIAASDQATFYRVLGQALTTLDDPHVSLDIPPELEDSLFVPALWVGAVINRRPWIAITESYFPESHRLLKWGELLAVDGHPGPFDTQLLDDLLLSNRGETRRLRVRTLDSTEIEFDAPCTVPRSVWALSTRAHELPRRAHPLVRPTAPPGVVVPEYLTLRLGARSEVAYLRLDSFKHELLGQTEASLCDQIGLLCETARGAESILIDVRANTGGSLSASTRLVNAFIEDREPELPVSLLIPATGPSSIPGTRTRLLGLVRVAPAPDLPPPIRGRIVVLVDDLSASGAEYVAAVLRCRRNAVIVGATTSGAEWVTFDWPLSDGSILALGLGGGLTRECGGSFQRIGITPDVTLPYPHHLAEEEGFPAARLAFDNSILAEGLRQCGLDPAEWMDMEE